MGKDTINVNILGYNGNLSIEKMYEIPYKRLSTITGGEDSVLDLIEFDDNELQEELASNEVLTSMIIKNNSSTTIKKNVTVYMEDNVLEFRKKIQLLTGIPLYKQHVYYIYQDHAIPMSYKISNLTALKIDAREIKAGTNVIENVPVDQSAIANGEDNFMITSYEEFRIMGDIINKTTEFYVLSADEIFKDRSAFEVQIGDAYTLKLLYYSFVIKYFPMMSLDIFVQYIKNEDDILNKFPNLFPDNDEMIKQYDNFDQIINKLNLPSVNKELIIGISYSVLVQKGYQQVNLRNLFDLFVLSDNIPFIRCKCMIGNQMVNLTKTYKKAKVFKEKLADNSVIIGIQMQLNNDQFTAASLHILSNGTYLVRSNWRDDFYITYNNLYDITMKNINPILGYINSFGHAISDKQFTEVSKMTKIHDMNLSIYWKRSLLNKNFSILMNAVQMIINAGIINPKQTAGTVLEYVFIKGMYKFNHQLIEDLVKGVNNYYARFYDGNIRQKWESLFGKNRIFRIHHRYADIRFDITNIKQEERDVVYNVVDKIVSYAAKYMIAEQNTKDVDKKLRKLKELDPELYDFKKAHRSREILSKKCQKPLQPIIYSKDEFAEYKKKLKKPDLDNILEYWNFTKNEPAFYECPNKKFPYARFITGVHPNGYCIPCCKKSLPLEDPTNKKTIIHNSCLKNHTFTSEKVDDKKSRYVSNFGKDLDPGRLSFLPEDLIGTLFHEKTNIEDEECKHDVEFYILGVNQYYRKLNVGILYCASITMNLQIDEIIDNVFDFILKNPILVQSFIEVHKIAELIEAFIGMKFQKFKYAKMRKNKASSKDIITESTSIIKASTGGNEYYSMLEDKWNDIFLALLPLVYDWRFITIKILPGNAYLNIPKTLKNWKDYLTSKISIIIQKPSDRNENLYFYYPVIYGNKEVFYRDTEIDQVYFTADDRIIRNIVDMISIKLIKLDFTKLDLSKITMFSEYSKIPIKKYFVNNRNECYAVLIDGIYIPVHISFHESRENDNDPYQSRCGYANLMKFIAKYNKFAISKKFDIITPEKWLYVQGIKDKSKQYIGFLAQGLQFYCKMTATNTKKLKLLCEKQLYYDPIVLNKFVKMSGYYDQKEYLRTHIAIYNKRLYVMMLVEFIDLINNERNEKKRKELKTYIAKHNLHKQYKGAHIDDMIPADDDRITIKRMITEYLYEHNDKDILLKSIDNNIFTFDKLILVELRKISDPVLLKKKLKELSKRIIVEDKVPHIIEFENIYTTCNEKNGTYCRKHKLIIPRGQLDGLLDILVTDILNNYKKKILFSRVLYQSTIDPFKFKKNPYEEIKYTM